MSDVALHPATADRYEDALDAIGAGGGAGCCCQYWRMSSSEYGGSTLEQRRAALREQTAVTPAPGVLAYVGGIPVGWCGFGPRDRLERLVRSRTIPVVDDIPVWAIFCFAIRVGYRRTGLGHALLGAAIAYAREQGAPALEAYPIDTAGKRVHGTAAYVGTTGMFEAAGFRRIVETAAHSARLPRWLVRLEL